MDPIKLYRRNESPFWQAQIVVAADKTLRISTRETDQTKAYQIAYKRYIEAKTRYDMGIRDEAVTFGQAFSAWSGRQHSKNHQTYLCWLQRQWGARLLGEIQTAELNRWFAGLALGSSRKGDIARIIRGVYAHAVANKQITLDAVPQIKIPADPENPRCGSAWNRNPGDGVIGVQTGPPRHGVPECSRNHGSRVQDAGGGNDREDSSRTVRSGKGDQGDLS